MDMWKFIEEKFVILEKNVLGYKEMIKTGDELKAKGEEYNKNAYENAKRRLEFYEKIKQCLPEKKLSDDVLEGVRAWVRQSFYMIIRSDGPEETVSYDSIPKAFKEFVEALDDEPELQKIKQPLTGIFDTDYGYNNCPDIDDKLDDIKVQKDYFPLTKMDYPEMKEAIKPLNEKYKKFL